MRAQIRRNNRKILLIDLQGLLSRMEILINNLQDRENIDTEKFHQIAQDVLTNLQCSETCELSITLVDDQEIRRLNREYRDIDQSTDVLSFALQEGKIPQRIQLHSENDAYPLILGDVILATETIQRQAQEMSHSYEEELYFLLIHGILHLLGYDHQSDAEAQKMQHLEQKLFHHLHINRNES